jgi:hypothetical protein
MTKAEYINELITRIHPWYALEFIFINDMSIVFKVGSTNVESRYDHLDECWVMESLNDSSSSFVDRLNAIMRGGTRDEDGNINV